jgi:hypothetical protein
MKTQLLSEKENWYLFSRTQGAILNNPPQRSGLLSISLAGRRKFLQ